MPTLLDSLVTQNEKQKLDNNYKIAETKNEQSKFNRMYEARLNELNSHNEDRKLASEKLKYEQKTQKLKEDFIEKLMNEGSGPMAIGGDLVSQFNVPTEDGAAELPILATG